MVSADSCMFEREQTHSNKSQNETDMFIFIRVRYSNFSPQFVKTVTQEAIFLVVSIEFSSDYSYRLKKLRNTLFGIHIQRKKRFCEIAF